MIWNHDISLHRVIHRGDLRIAIRSPYDPAISVVIKDLPDRRYSKTMRCWHLPYTAAHLRAAIDLMPNASVADELHDLCLIENQ